MRNESNDSLSMAVPPLVRPIYGMAILFTAHVQWQSY